MQEQRDKRFTGRNLRLEGESEKGGFVFPSARPGPQRRVKVLHSWEEYGQAHFRCKGMALAGGICYRGRMKNRLYLMGLFCFLWLARVGGGAVLGASAFQTPAGWLGIQLDVTSGLSSVRVFFDVDGPSRGEPSTGADFLLEGGRFFRYPEGATDWSWDELPPPFILRDAATLTYVLPSIPFSGRVRWFVQAMRPDWSPAGRFPEKGVLEFSAGALPVEPLAARVAPVNLQELLARHPRTLSFRVEAEIKDRIWTDAGSDAGLAWRAAALEEPVSFWMGLVDAASGAQAELKLSNPSASGECLRWMGRELETDWIVMAEPSGQGGDWMFTVQLSSEEDRCLRLGVGVSLNPEGWDWHDDVRMVRRVVGHEGVMENVMPVSWGAKGRQSVYPIGVISRTSGVLSVETDLSEPRAFVLQADPGRSFFGVWYDVALTRMTSNFPGRAAFRCAFRSWKNPAMPFRTALAGLYKRTAFFEKSPALPMGAGLMAPAFPQLSNAADYGFAWWCEEEASPRDASWPQGPVLGIVKMAPALFQAFVPPGFPVEAAAVEDLMRLLSSKGDAGQRDSAASALLSAARAPGGVRQIHLPESADASRAWMELNLDPELAVSPALPVSRAMTEWRRISEEIKRGRGTGFLLDAISSLSALDYQAPALAVADYPCVFQAGLFHPAVATAFSAVEYLAPLSGFLREKGLPLMGAVEGPAHPFIFPCLSAAVGKIPAGPAGRYADPPDSLLNYYRAMMGKKAMMLRVQPELSLFSSNAVQRFFMDSLFLGFLPSLEVAEGSTQALAEWLEREGAAWRTYLPLIRRLAEAGWNPLGALGVQAGEDVQIEAFGSLGGIRHLTLKNPGSFSEAVLRVPVKGREFLVSPLTARAEWLWAEGEAGVASFRIPLRAGEVETLDRVPLASAQDELLFLKSWKAPSGAPEACVKNVQSLLQEAPLNAVCRVAWPWPSVKGQENVVRLQVVNTGQQPLEVRELKVISSRHYRPFEQQDQQVAGGVSGMLEGFYTDEDEEADRWLEVQWVLVRGADTVFCSRLIHPDWVPPVEVSAPCTRIEATGDTAFLPLQIQNHSRKEQRVILRYEGDFKGGRLEVLVAPESVKPVELTVKAGRSREGQMFVKASVADQPVFQGWYEVFFRQD